MRHLLIALPLLLLQVPAAQAQVFVNIGIQLPVYPQLQRVPGYPVYYAPDAPGNVFFYDGLYWVFWDDNWYYSSWYNGPWQIMAPLYVPVYLLRVPVRYYRHPPLYFTRWRADAPPRWGEHWGHDWSQRRDGWNRWDRAKAPAPAPLPDYQRSYPQARYPQAGEQDRIRSEHYRYQPRNPTVRAQLAAPTPQHAPQPAPPMQGRPPQREDVRRPERNERPPMPMERPEPRVDRREVQPPMRPLEPEQRRARPSERPAAPEPRQAPQWQQPRQPDFQRQQPPPQRQAPMRAEPIQPQQGQDRGSPGPRRFEDERGRGNHNNRGDDRRNRD